MDGIRLKLEEFLEDYSKLIILGIGNDIRGDDGLGPYIINRLSNLNEDVSNNGSLEDTYIDNPINLEDIIHFSNNILLINGGSVPENFTGPIKKFNPSHIIIIDACLMNMNPGEVNIVSKENIVNISVSTHSMSLAYLIKYLESSSDDITVNKDSNLEINENSNLEIHNDFKMLFVGIEPEIMDLSFDLTDSVKESCDNLINIIDDLIQE